MANHNKSLQSYSDIRQLYERVIASGPISLTFPTKAKAVYFIGRANMFRVLLRKRSEAEGGEFASPYDHLMNCRPGNDCKVVIKPRGFDFVAEDLDGNEIELSLSSPVPPLPLHLSSSPDASHVKPSPLAEDDLSFLDDFEKSYKVEGGDANR